MFPQVGNTEIWDACCDSKSPVYPEDTGAKEELRIVVIESALPLHAKQEGDG